MWTPWIGSKYEQQKLLLLGESHYDWVDEETGILQRPEPDAPCMVVGESRVAPLKGAPTMIKLTRALCNGESPSPEQAAEAWDGVAFTNYIPVSVGLGPRPRPSPVAWRQAAEQWHRILERLKPRVVIVLGLTMWNNMPETQVIESDLVQGYSLENGDTAMCYAINHPARGPSWTEYAAFISKAAGMA
jgi:hypothetical protein